MCQVIWRVASKWNTKLQRLTNLCDKRSQVRHSCRITPHFFLFLIKDYKQYKPIGAAPRWHFFGGGKGAFGQKRVLRSAGYGFPRRKKSSASRQYCKCILIESKLCTIQYYNITIKYCNNVQYYENSIAKYHITVRHKIFETKAL
jgi:hypothetical protein